MWGCLQPCSSTIYAIFGNSKSSNSEMVLFGSELVKLLGAGTHYYKWFLASKYGYWIHLNDCEENQVTMRVFFDLNVESVEFSDGPWTPMWFGAGSLIEIFFLMRMRFFLVLMVRSNIICISFMFFSSIWLDAWDSLSGAGHKDVVHHFLMPCVPKTMPPFFLPHSSSLLPPVPQFHNCMWITGLQSFVLCPHPNLIVSTCSSLDTAFWKHS